LIKKGDRVGSSEAALLQMLDIKPFEYGLVCVSVYDNGIPSNVSILEKKEPDILGKFVEGLSNVAALSLGLSFPTEPAFPHVVRNAFKNLASVAVETDYEFSQVKELKEFIKNPAAFVSSAPPVKEKEAPKLEDDDEPAAFDLFGSNPKEDDDDPAVFDLFGSKPKDGDDNNEPFTFDLFS